MERRLIHFLNKQKHDHQFSVYHQVLEESYIPLRWACLQGISEEEGQRYYSVKLMKYCHITPRHQYGNFLQGISSGGLRHICADGQTIAGLLAFVHVDEPGDIVIQGKDSWAITVRQLGELDLFKENYSIFTKFEIKDSKEEPKENNDITGCILKSKHNYKVHITYYIPSFNAEPIDSYCELNDNVLSAYNELADLLNNVVSVIALYTASISVIYNSYDYSNSINMLNIKRKNMG